MGKIIGIDLGTTNCCVAVTEGTEQTVVPSREGSRTVPSMVGFTTAGERLVGQIAKRQAITNANNTVYAVKRLIGRKIDSDEIRRVEEFLPYSLAEAENGDVKISIQDRLYSPEEISAMLLGHMKEVAEEYLGEAVDEAIITVPAYFNDAQRQATKDAGRIAGLDVLRIINEPTAASLAYGVDQIREETLAVFDLGGGTFDISILRLSEGVHEVLSTSGDTFLGGEDFDQRIINWLATCFQEEHGTDLRQDRMALQRLKEAAEKAKCELSTEEEAVITLPFISAGEGGTKHINKTLTREHFQSMVEDLVQRTVGPCREALSAAGLDVRQIDQVLLVGGQTRTPRVIELVRELFGREPSRDRNPEEVVGLGAAIQGAILGGEIKDMVLLDVTPLSLGIETRGGMFTKLIDRNTTIPTKSTQVFTTVVDNQTKVEIHALQGEREVIDENRSLGRFDLVGIPPAPRGVPQIEVTFAIDSNGIVNITARDRTSGKEQAMKITPSGGLSEDEIRKVIEDSRAHAADDQKRRELVRTIRNLEGLLYSVEKSFSEYGQILQEGERSRVRATIDRARREAAGENLKGCKECLAELQQVSKVLSNSLFGGGSSD
jgi:molecular chaperone DnaK